MREPAVPPLTHLLTLTNDKGIIEHARGAIPHPKLGYCTDDAGRALGLMSVLPSTWATKRVAEVSLGFLEEAGAGERNFRLRRRADGSWSHDAPSDDATARALQGLASAATVAPWADVRRRSCYLFADKARGFESAYLRSNAHAVLAAAAILEVEPRDRVARALFNRAAAALPWHFNFSFWPWPEARLSYSNALIPEAMMVAARERHDREGLKVALDLLTWLVDEESHGGHFSFTPVGGRGAGEPKPGFDQQPIEAWAMADAASRAFRLTGNRAWADVVRRAEHWFHRSNDAAVPVADPVVGAGFDGLGPRGVNLNRGAESTLAYLATTWRGAQAQFLTGRSTW